jgi:hypothetical protein
MIVIIINDYNKIFLFLFCFVCYGFFFFNILLQLNGGNWASGGCAAADDPILMTDARCQCDAAKQFYMQTNPNGTLSPLLCLRSVAIYLLAIIDPHHSATLDNAFTLYAEQAEILDPNTPSWHCEACPNTVLMNPRIFLRSVLYIALALFHTPSPPPPLLCPL